METTLLPIGDASGGVDDPDAGPELTVGVPFGV
jgi:hypothetical protein